MYLDIGADPGSVTSLVDTMMHSKVGSKEWLEANRDLLALGRETAVPGNLPSNQIALPQPPPQQPMSAPINWNKVLLFGGIGLLLVLLLRRR